MPCCRTAFPQLRTPGSLRSVGCSTSHLFGLQIFGGGSTKGQSKKKPTKGHIAGVLLLSSASEPGLLDFYTSPEPGSIQNPGSPEDFEAVTVPRIGTAGNSTAAPRHGSDPVLRKSWPPLLGPKRDFSLLILQAELQHMELNRSDPVRNKQQ